MRKPRYGRPNRASLLGVMLLNGLVGAIVLYLVCTLFGVSTIILNGLAAHGIQVSERWSVVLPMLPGVAIGMGCLWYWLVIIGRTKGVQWGGALVYGGVLAACNVPIAGLILGLAEGVPSDQLLMLMLIALALMMLSPAMIVAMLLSGGIMGLFNARLAHAWIAWYKKV